MRSLGLAALATVVALVAVAHADVPTIRAPAGWHVDEAQSQALAAKLARLSHFGLSSGARLGSADVYVPDQPGVVLSVVVASASANRELAEAARAAVDELHATATRAALAGSGIVEEGWQEQVDPAAKQIEATLAWRDTSAKTSSTARLLIVADEAHLVSVTGECFASDDADAKLVADCKAALATLDPGIAANRRVPLQLAPAGTRPTPPAGSGQEPPRMGDGSRTPLPPITVSRETRTTDRRPVYVGIGLVVLAVVFWWNRRRRAPARGQP
jgi:hypothetical protein